ncbi:MAG: phosphatase PAP2 family protein [Butyrivibrio sp.]|nr:phosphatase PAP2 family protein [Butyrivibrio sp.]
MSKLQQKTSNRPAATPLTRARIIDTIGCFVPLFIYGVIYWTWFWRLERTNHLHYHVIHSSLDDLIPFAEIFIVPYYAWFIYVSFAILFFLFKYDLEDYIRLSFFLCSGMTVFLVVSTLWPNIQYLRPAVMPRDNIFTHMVANLYATDTPTNIWPSIHVYNSIGAHIAISGSKRFSPWMKRCSFVMATLIILSTMFLKQHSVLDVVAAFVMALVFYALTYRSEWAPALAQRHYERRSAGAAQ